MQHQILTNAVDRLSDINTLSRLFDKDTRVFRMPSEKVLGEIVDIARDIRELASSSSRPDETNEARIFSLGLGYVSNLFAFDYAFSYLAESLGYEHRLGLRVEF